MNRVLTSLAALVAAGILAAGCGSSGSSSTNTGSAASTGSSANSAGGGYGGGAPAKTQTQTTTSSAVGASGTGSAASTALALTAQETNGLSFSKKALTAKAGSVTITMDNPSANSLPHSIAVEGNGVDQKGQIMQPGGTSKVALDLKPGKYTFYCPVPGHRQAGMQGTLLVR